MLRKTINFYDQNIARLFIHWAWKHPKEVDGIRGKVGAHWTNEKWFFTYKL